jgi:predicted GNAT family acetyltransferase
VLASEHPELRGVVGSAEACAAFAQRWHALTGRSHALRHRMRNHVLDQLVLPATVPGNARVADGADREWLLAMHGAFAEEARVSWTSQSAQRTIDERLAAGLFRVWSDDGDVAFAGFTYAGSEAARIAPVYTLPNFRRCGYGAALVGALCADLLASGRRVFLVTDVTNPTSNQLYARLGFRPLDEFCELDFVGPG